MGLGSSVSHGLLARSASEIVADQLCLGSKGHVFPWYFPASYQKAAKYYYKRTKPGLVIALDVTYHDMKVLEYTSDKEKVLETLVPALALDCKSEFYECTPDGNESYVKAENYRPIVVLGDIFFENLVDCTQGKPPQGYRIENAKPRPKKHCFEEYAQLNRYLRTLADRYPNIHLYHANHFFTSLVKYPHSIYYNAGTRQTFFSRETPSIEARVVGIVGASEKDVIVSFNTGQNHLEEMKYAKFRTLYSAGRFNRRTGLPVPFVKTPAEERNRDPSYIPLLTEYP